MTYVDTTVALNGSYVYRVAADNVAGTSAWSNPADRPRGGPGGARDPDGDRAPGGNQRGATITWGAVPTATSYSSSGARATFATGVTTDVGAVTTYTNRQHQPHCQLVLPDGCGQRAGQSGWSNAQSVTPAP